MRDDIRQFCSSDSSVQSASWSQTQRSEIHTFDKLHLNSSALHWRAAPGRYQSTPAFIYHTNVISSETYMPYKVLNILTYLKMAVTTWTCCLALHFSAQKFIAKDTINWVSRHRNHQWHQFSFHHFTGKLAGTRPFLSLTSRSCIYKENSPIICNLVKLSGTSKHYRCMFNNYTVSG